MNFRILVMGVAAAAVLTVASATQADDSAMARQIAELQRIVAQQSQEISQLRTAQGGNWLNERRAEEVKALVQEVLADADTRASLLDGSLQAGWNKGFFLKDADGNFLLKLKGMIQTRFVAGFQDQTTNSDGDDSRTGFENTRVRFGFVGHVIDPSWKYVIWTGYGSTASNALLDVAITKTFDGGWYVKAGQFKVPVWREWTVSETRQQFVERSLLTSAFAGSYTQGLVVGVNKEKFKLALSVNDGTGGSNSTWNAYDNEVALSARADVLLAGTWAQNADFQSWQGEDQMLVVGGGLHYQRGESGTTNGVGGVGPEVDVFRWSVDGSLELGGGNLFAAIIGSHSSGDTGVASTDQLGILLQGGYFVTKNVEVMARYEWGDDDMASTEDLSILSLGGSYYFAKHAAKITCDLGYAFNQVSSTFASTKAGYQADAAGSDGQVVLRAQMQLLF